MIFRYKLWGKIVKVSRSKIEFYFSFCQNCKIVGSLTNIYTICFKEIKLKLRNFRYAEKLTEVICRREIEVCRSIKFHLLLRERICQFTWLRNIIINYVYYEIKNLHHRDSTNQIKSWIRKCTKNYIAQLLVTRLKSGKLLSLVLFIQNKPEFT